VRRTPLCALLGGEGAAEWFATTHDLYLVLKRIAEDPGDLSPADGRPATRAAAHARLARMLCADTETCTPAETTELANRLHERQLILVRQAFDAVASRLPGKPATVIVSGSGEFLAREVINLEPRLGIQCLSLREILGNNVSQAACAYALAVLAGEQPTHEV
jgi:uncharacterized hydantoinase/oxoprolinase family protein